MHAPVPHDCHLRLTCSQRARHRCWTMIVTGCMRLRAAVCGGRAAHRVPAAGCVPGAAGVALHRVAGRCGAALNKQTLCASPVGTCVSAAPRRWQVRGRVQQACLRASPAGACVSAASCVVQQRCARGASSLASASRLPARRPHGCCAGGSLRMSYGRPSMTASSNGPPGAQAAQTLWQAVTCWAINGYI